MNFELMKRLADQWSGKRTKSDSDTMIPTMLTLVVALASWMLSLAEAGAFR
jgi:hypothetical protein